jgi:adenine phosphoribosyltransferase
MKSFQDAPLEFYKDFPAPGVNFIDVGSVFENPDSWLDAIEDLSQKLYKENVGFDFIVAMDARGFMLAGALALEHHVGFAMARKPGKMPGDTIAIDYEREYGTARIELQPERVKGNRILIVDDVLATGGTIEAAATLVRQMGKEVVGAACLFDVAYFRDKRKLTIPAYTLRDV